MENNIKLADLILERGTGIINEAIQEITDSPYSHVAGLAKPNELIEANGFRHTGYQALDYYDKIADVYTCDILTDEQRNDIVKFVTKYIGTHYNYFLLVAEFFRYVFHWIIPYEEGTNKICSTLWVEAYRSVGIDLVPNVKFPSPAEIACSPLLRKVCSL